MPSLQTLIAQQLANGKPNQEELMKIAQEMQRQLGEQIQQHPKDTLDELLQLLNISAECHIQCLNIFSTAPNIILECETNTHHIKPYSAMILHMWKANMDIQCIKNAASAVMYVCVYMMKVEKGMGELLK